ncbi:unnamed protein product [Fraxinus pennsylvanica]|uniref:BHLH domain-containing protein n=1 Tax=Fraxinus pennsylvanica TaxID=56036 RepID=A0AAD2E2L7_9LAMI|nr:unnamed protein product [Fraxinus pennsylvanica]
MEKGKTKSSPSATRPRKTERKVVEKNRRNQMKIHYSNLLCLLPDHGSKEAMPLPDQIDEAVAYIESLKMKVEKMKEKKESLMPRKRSHSCITSEVKVNTKSSRPLVEVHDMGSNMGNSTFQILHDKVGKSRMGLEATTMSRRLKDLICGSTCSEVESNLDLWDYGLFGPDIWGLGISEVIDAHNISEYSQWF